MELIELIPNHPTECRIAGDSRPVKLSSGAGCLYTLSDGRLLHLASSAADSLAHLELKPGESFFVCLRHTAGTVYWDLWLSPETEKARARAEAPELERQLAESISIARRRRSPETAVSAETLPATGTDGPAPARKPAIAAVAGGKRRTAGEPIPLNVAFAEITRFVVRTLDESGEQWSENSRQDLISTILIAAQKANLLTVWEREGEAA